MGGDRCNYSFVSHCYFGLMLNGSFHTFGHRGYTVVVENGLYRLRLHTERFTTLRGLDRYINKIERYSSNIIRRAINNSSNESEST